MVETESLSHPKTMSTGVPIENFIRFGHNVPISAFVTDINPVNTSSFEISARFDELDETVAVMRVDGTGRIISSYSLSLASPTVVMDEIVPRVRSTEADTYVFFNVQRDVTYTSEPLQTIALVKISNKEVAWVKSINETSIEGTTMTATSDGGVVIVGCWRTLSGCSPSFVTKFNSDGGVVWQSETSTLILSSVYEATGGIIHVTGAVPDEDDPTATDALWVALDTTAGTINFAVKSNRLISALRVPSTSDRVYWLKVETQIAGLYTFLQYRISNERILSSIQWLSADNEGNSCGLYDAESVLCAIQEEDMLVYERYSLSLRTRQSSVSIPLNSADDALDASSLWYSGPAESVLVYPSIRGKAGKGVSVFRWSDAQIESDDVATCYIANSTAYPPMEEIELDASMFDISTDASFTFNVINVIQYESLDAAEFATVGTLSTSVLNSQYCTPVTTTDATDPLLNPLYYLLLIPIVFSIYVCAVWCGLIGGTKTLCKCPTRHQYAAAAADKDGAADGGASTVLSSTLDLLAVDDITGDSVGASAHRRNERARAKEEAYKLEMERRAEELAQEVDRQYLYSRQLQEEAQKRRHFARRLGGEELEMAESNFQDLKKLSTYDIINEITI